MIRPHLKFLLMRPVLGLLKVFEIVAVAFGLVVGMYIPVYGEIVIDASISPESLTVGDKFVYVNRVDIIPNTRIEPAPPAEQLGEATVLSDIAKLKESPEGTVSYACTLAVYKSGKSDIPSFTFVLTDSTGNSEEINGRGLTVEIGSVLPPDTTGLDIADIREPHRLRGPIWPYLAIPLAVSLLAVGAYLLYRRLRGRPEIPQAPVRSPWEVAFERLELLKNERHYEFGRKQQFYFELSTIVRAYIEGRYDFPALESTTYELETDSRLHAVGDKSYGKLIEFLHRADMAKFAKTIPAGKEADTDLAFAFDLVRETIPVIEEPAGETDTVAAVGRADAQV